MLAGLHAPADGRRSSTASPSASINVHPSLLPEFPGAHAIEEALAAGERETGATVHYVDEGVDTGPVIAQERVSVEDDDTVESSVPASRRSSTACCRGW